jgi:immunity protein 52 of polymorphic toxin system
MSHIVGAYWGQRKESRQACASRISAFLQALAAQDAALSRWYRQLASRKEPLRELPHDVDGLLPRLGVNRADIGGEVMVELGFDFSAWNGWKADMQASLSVYCGAFSPFVGNSAVVSFDPEASPTPDLLQGILRAAVTAFDPDDGVVVSHATLSAQASPSILERPALFRYKRGAGFSVD